jgi:hypothetical protein
MGDGWTGQSSSKIYQNFWNLRSLSSIKISLNAIRRLLTVKQRRRKMSFTKQE